MTEGPVTRDERFQAQAAERSRLALEALGEYVHNLREAADAAALLERAKAAAYATPEVEWVTYSKEDLEALRQQDTVADAAVDEDFFEEDEPVEDVLAAFEAGEKFVTEEPPHSAGWCAPSP